MAGVRFLDAQTCPWTQGLHTSSLSSTPGIRWFRIGVVLLLDWLQTKADKAQSTQGCVVVQKEPFFLSPSKLGKRGEVPNLRPMYVAYTPRPPGYTTICRNFNLCVLLPWGSLWIFRRVRDLIPRHPHGRILGRSQIWGLYKSPKPLGQRATHTYSSVSKKNPK